MNNKNDEFILAVAASFLMGAAALLVLKAKKEMQMQALINDYNSDGITFNNNVPSFCPLSHMTTKPSTQNFSYSELINSTDRAEIPKILWGNAQELLNNLQIIRNTLNQIYGGETQIIISKNGGFRSPLQNASSGGASASKHMCAMAGDIKAKNSKVNISPLELHTVIESLMDTGKIKAGGLKQYSTFVHYDIRGYKTTWKLSDSFVFDMPEPKTDFM